METYEIILDNGTSVFARRPIANEGDDDVKCAGVHARATSEVNLLQWLEKARMPTPRIIYACSEFYIMSKLPGDVLMNVFSLLSTKKKVCSAHLRLTDRLPLISYKESLVISYAQTFVELAVLEVPQEIGSTSIGHAPGTLSVVPRAGLPPFEAADRNFADIREYFDYLQSGRRIVAYENCTSDAEKAVIDELLRTLEDYIDVRISKLPDNVLRCALMHNDLNDSNILVDGESGVVTGIIDWELHSIIPLCLAAEYPRFLRRDGMLDPKYNESNMWWLESPQESERLMALFEKVSWIYFCGALL